MTSQVCLAQGADYNFIPVFLKPVLPQQCSVRYCPPAQAEEGDMLGLLFSPRPALNKWTCNIVWAGQAANIIPGGLRVTCQIELLLGRPVKPENKP